MTSDLDQAVLHLGDLGGDAGVGGVGQHPGVVEADAPSANAASMLSRSTRNLFATRTRADATRRGTRPCQVNQATVDNPRSRSQPSRASSSPNR